MATRLAHTDWMQHDPQAFAKVTLAILKHIRSFPLQTVMHNQRVKLVRHPSEFCIAAHTATERPCHLVCSAIELPVLCILGKAPAAIHASWHAVAAVC